MVVVVVVVVVIVAAAAVVVVVVVVVLLLEEEDNVNSYCISTLCDQLCESISREGSLTSPNVKLTTSPLARWLRLWLVVIYPIS